MYADGGGKDGYPVAEDGSPIIELDQVDIRAERDGWLKRMANRFARNIKQQWSKVGISYPTNCNGCSGMATWHADLDDAQMMLDLIGMTDIPIISQTAELGSGLISLARGDATGAALSGGSMVPVFGAAATVTKIGRNTMKAGEVVADAGKVAVKELGKSINQLNKAIQTGNVPRGIKRFDKGRGTKNLPQDEVHFDNGASLYRDGTWRHDKGHTLTNEQIKFLKEHGWNIPR